MNQTITTQDQTQNQVRQPQNQSCNQTQSPQSTLIPVAKHRPDFAKTPPPDRATCENYTNYTQKADFLRPVAAEEAIPGVLTPIPAGNIVPNRYQPRKRFDAASLNRLADSIRQYGILQPITVRQVPDSEPPKYEIICGERRFRAGILAGLDTFQCYLLHENDMRVAELSVIENLLRDDLNIFEQAEAFQLLITTFGLTQQQVADRIRLSQSAVANKLRLMKFGRDEQQEILENGLTERHARCLLRLNDPGVRLKFISLIAKDQLNVSATEQLVEKYIKYTSTDHAAPPAITKRPHISAGILRDVRVFTNTIEKAADILRNSGIVVETQCAEEPESYVYTIKVAKNLRGA